MSFDTAISFVDKVKHHYVNDRNFYNEFIGIFESYQRKSTPIQEVHESNTGKVRVLFKDSRGPQSSRPISKNCYLLMQRDIGTLRRRMPNKMLFHCHFIYPRDIRCGPSSEWPLRTVSRKATYESEHVQSVTGRLAKAWDSSIAHATWRVLQSSSSKRVEART